jgi:hypothetical protein
VSIAKVIKMTIFVIIFVNDEDNKRLLEDISKELSFN